MLLIVVDLNYILNMAIRVGVVNSLTHYTKSPFLCINCGFNLEFLFWKHNVANLLRRKI